MEITIHQEIYYSNKKLVPIKDVAESLLALEAIIRQSPDLLEAMFPGTEISFVEIYINELKSDSLWEDVVVKFIFKDQKNLDQFIANIRERVGMDNLTNNQHLLSIIIISLIFISVLYVLNKDQAALPEQKTTIEANNNTIIQIGAGMVDLSAQDFKAIIDSAIKDKNSLAKDAAKFVAPAKLVMMLLELYHVLSLTQTRKYTLKILKILNLKFEPLTLIVINEDGLL